MNETKTSAEWQEQFPNPKVYDPDGWDRRNFQFSWYEEQITLEEYKTRAGHSTIMGFHLETDLWNSE